jgi:tetratricopeptide (TPR) repeat protein
MLDGGATEEGMPYLVMERITGTPITAYADENQLSLQARLQLFLQVCEAVQYAHASLIIHRDIKPANILITADGTPRLLDFGLARVLADDSIEPQTTGAFLMTPAYASPEQMAGRAMTTSTDVYSLGAVLYELLTGRPPHLLTGLSPLDAATAICHSEAEFPSRTADNPLVPARQLRGDLDNILQMALRKDPARRYRSIEQFAADLQRHQEGLPVWARADTLPYRAVKFGQRNRWFLAAGVVVFLALAIGIFTSQMAARRERRRFDQVRQLVNRVLFRVHDAIQPLAGSLPARELILQNALEYLNSLSAEAAGDPELLNELSDAYRNLGLLQGTALGPTRGDSRAGMASLRKGMELGRLAVAKQPRNPAFLAGLGATLLELTRFHAHASDFTSARQTAEEAIGILERALALQPGDRTILDRLGQTYTFLGLDVIAQTGDVAAAASLVQKGVYIGEQLVAAEATPRSQDVLAYSYGSLGRLLARAKDTEGSRKAYQRAVDIREQLVSEYPENAEYLRGLLITYGGLADRIAEACTEEQVAGAAAARPIYEKMVTLARKLNVDRKDRTAQVDLGHTLLRMGCVEGNDGNHAKALDLLNEGLAATRPFANLETAPTGLLTLRTILLVQHGRVLLEGNRAAEAIPQLQHALQTLLAVERRAPGVADTWARKLSIYGRLAVARGKLGQKAALDALAAEARVAIQAQPTPRLPTTFMANTATAPLRFAEAYHLLRDERTACLWWQASVEAWSRVASHGEMPPGFQAMQQQAATHAAGCPR